MAVKALFFILLAYGLATIVLYLLFRQMEYLRWAFAAAAVTTIAFITGSPFIVLAIIVMIVSLSVQLKAVDKLALYFIFLPLLPGTWGMTIPGFLPGMALLLDLGHGLSLSLVILFPLWVAYLSSADDDKLYMLSGKSKRLDVLVVVYFVVYMAVSVRAPSISGALREILTIFLAFFLPYFIFSRIVRNMDDFFVIFKALLFSVVLTGLVGIFSEVLSWNFYGELRSSMLHGVYKQAAFLFRYGMLRIDVTMLSPISLGYFFVVGLFSLTSLSAWYKKRSPSFLLLTVLLLVPLIFTVSRGAWLMAIIYTVGFIFFVQRNVGIQVFLVFFSAIGGGAYTFLGGGGYSDDTGSFDFRSQLFDISRRVFFQNPLLGDLDFRSNPLYDPLRLPNGFIDIVNTYLGIILADGVVVFFLFVIVIIFSMILLLKGVNMQQLTKSAEGLKARRVGVGLAAIIMASFFMFGTVSAMGYMMTYHWILIGLTVAYLNMVNNLQHEKS